MKITFEGADLNAVLSDMQTFANHIASMRAQPTALAPVSLPEKKKRKKNRIETTPAHEDKEIRSVNREVIESPATDDGPIPTSDEPKSQPNLAGRVGAMAALKQINDLKGITLAREILSQFSCQRFSELKEEDYSPFITACQKALG